MARAKRTERAEARRRYRAATVGTAAEGADDVEAPAVPAAALPRGYRDRRPASPADPRGAQPERSGFLGTLRAAAGPMDIAGDIRALPSLLVSRAALVPGAVILATTVAMLIPGMLANQYIALAGNVILQPPPMIIAFLAGMLAPRGAWLLGGLTGMLSGLGFVVVSAVATMNTDTLVTPLGFTYAPTSDQKLAYLQSIIVSSLATGLLFGIAVGAFAGFYRRFLNLSSPQRQQSRRR